MACRFLPCTTLLSFGPSLASASSPNAQSTCSDSGKPYFFTICAVFKNEAVNIHEWVSHYLLEGADHIFLVDNDSDDDFTAVVQPFIDRGQVTLLVNRKHHAQMDILSNYILPIANVTEWMLNVDLDELVYAKHGSTSETLRKIPCSIASIEMPWKMYGSAGHKQHPTGSLVKNFLKRSNSTSPNQKAFFRSSMTQKILIHSAEVHGEILTLSPGEECINEGCTKAVHSEYISSPDVLQLNHYPIQSLQWFVNTKMSRGDVNTGAAENVRTFGYFESYDAASNDIEDSALYLKHKHFFDSL